MKRKYLDKVIISFMMLIIIISCIKEKNLYQGKDDPDKVDPSITNSAYLYPFGSEIQNVTSEFVIKSKKELKADEVIFEIPPLKFNKSWLLMLTQDDCKQAAFCRTWAAINGKPISNSIPYSVDIGDSRELYYDVEQLYANDLPPNIIAASKTLGSTDGSGNEVRFAITTTLAPEEEWMTASTTVNPGLSNNYYRFYMKSGLVWSNVAEMLNYGTGIAFHDVSASDVKNPVDIVNHYNIAQNIIKKNLQNRGCKMLAEPNGNKTYVTAALQYPDIQTMVAQAGTVKLYPFAVVDDLKNKLLHRRFEDVFDIYKEEIKNQLQKPKPEREAIHIGVHNTGISCVEFLQWVNDTYGKDGDDSVWFPSQEEYYEYNYYRMHANIEIKQVDKNTIKLIVGLPSEKYFYYPSISVNLEGIKKEDITTISSSDEVTGFSYADYNNNLTINIDCRKYLLNHATHYVEQYEKQKTSKNDALYFVGMIKDSPEKSQLLKRLQ